MMYTFPVSNFFPLLSSHIPVLRPQVVSFGGYILDAAKDAALYLFEGLKGRITTLNLGIFCLVTIGLAVGAFIALYDNKNVLDKVKAERDEAVRNAAAAATAAEAAINELRDQLVAKDTAYKTETDLLRKEKLKAEASLSQLKPFVLDIRNKNTELEAKVKDLEEKLLAQARQASGNSASLVKKNSSTMSLGDKGRNPLVTVDLKENN